jgi:hypothetical protein
VRDFCWNQYCSSPFATFSFFSSIFKIRETSYSTSGPIEYLLRRKDILLFFGLTSTHSIQQHSRNMAPPSAYHDDVVETAASVHANGNDELATATHEPELTKQQAAKHQVSMQMPNRRATERDPYKEREYQKGRLVLAFRIFAKYGFDEGVAGHITLRVSPRCHHRYISTERRS